MDNFKKYIYKLICSIKNTLNKFYYKSRFNFNKHKTIEKMYEPMFKKQLEENKNLSSRLDKFKLSNKQLKAEISYYEKENPDLQKKISLLQNLLIK